MKNVKFLREKLQKLQAEIRQAEEEKLIGAGKIAFHFFKKESDFSDENFLKFKEKLIEFLHKFQ